MRAYALDIGGSSVKHGYVDVATNRLPKVDVLPIVNLNSREFEEVNSTVLELVGANASQESGIELIGVSTTGSVNSSGVVLNAGHFTGYKNIDWRKRISAHAKHIRNVSVMNDGRASAWAEYASLDDACDHFAHFVIGTGVGGALIVNGGFLVGDFENAGHLGHVKVNAKASTIVCSCGKSGCLETMASAPGIIESFNESQKRDRHATGVVAFSDVVDLAKGGEEHAIAAFEAGGFWLGVAISFVLNILNPKYVTIGGGVVEAAQELEQLTERDPFFETAKQTALELAHKRVATSTNIVRARFGNDGGLVGAASYACRRAME